MPEIKLPEICDFNTYIDLERSNKFMAANKKKEMTQLVAFEIKKQKLKKVDRINKITFIWRHKNRRKDFDNVEAAQKFIRDGMVQAGLVKNDGWKHMPPRTLHKHEVNKNNPGVTVVYK